MAADDTATLWEEVDILEATIDDMNPQWFHFLRERLFSAGALDMEVTATMMKKERVGHALKVLCPPHCSSMLVELIFQHTTTLGLRCRREKRAVLQRDFVSVETAYGAIAIKRAFWKDKVINVQPEYEDCVQQARHHATSLKEVYQAALVEYYKIFS
ncbi:nickel insertion protein [Heliorestis convoluta]|uniref:Nickel pincer cofactor biosynthesis protein LarC n=1 Tax=Heliorestis convoluta TaxID=356322 RepID=A0A5Q2N406_9FIRM|nr:nickel pincer cofactor biosynthesis protein LarC [Heliorestis convoluta]